MPVKPPKKGASKAQLDAINAKRERREADKAKANTPKAELKKSDAPAEAPAPESSPAPVEAPKPKRNPVFGALTAKIQEKRAKNRGIALQPQS